eukprot:scaffold216273_cov20-Tisochrysis_lutea.AAC.1
MSAIPCIPRGLSPQRRGRKGKERKRKVTWWLSSIFLAAMQAEGCVRGGYLAAAGPNEHGLRLHMAPTHLTARLHIALAHCCLLFHTHPICHGAGMHLKGFVAGCPCVCRKLAYVLQGFLVLEMLASSKPARVVPPNTLPEQVWCTAEAFTYQYEHNHITPMNLRSPCSAHWRNPHLGSCA